MFLEAARRVICLAALGGGLAACDTLSGMNPFEEKETILPGERQAVFKDSPAAPAAPQGAQIVMPAAHINSEWSQPGGDAANAPGNLALGSGKGWRAPGTSLGSRQLRTAAVPVVHQGRVFTYNGSGQVAAYSLGSGGRAWVASAQPDGSKDDFAAGGGIAAGDGRVVAVTGFRTAAAFSAEKGGRLWMVNMPEPARGAPTIVGGKVFFVSTRNTVYALNLADGSTVWTYAGIPESVGLISSASPAVSGNRVIVPSSAGEVIALDAGKGTVVWQGTLARGARYTAVSGLADVTARPVVSGGVVYAMGVSGRLAAMREATGDMIWEQRLASAHTPAVGGNGVFVITLSNTLVALDKASGKVAWSVQLPSQQGEKWAGPTLAGGNLWAGSNQGRLVAVNAASGQLVSERSVGEPVFVPPIVASGSLIVLSGGGTLTALQ
jgi:outer membrane protein assembly factor BamB